MLKILAILILSLFAICITGCDDHKSGNDKAFKVATDEVAEENVVVSASEEVDTDAEEAVPVKRNMRPAVKNTRVLKDIASLPTGFEIASSVDELLEAENHAP